jgi:N-methylhydantoinase A
MHVDPTAIAPRRLRIGVDSGGTFTDICVFDETAGRVSVWKVSSTPDDPSRAIADGIAQALSEMGAEGGIVYFGHGTTVATNALIQGRGAACGFVTTAGFRDVLELRRQRRPELYDLQTEKPPVLATRDLRLEVRERVLFDGTVHIPLHEDDARDAARRLRAAGVSAVAVGLLFSFMAPAHEARVAEILRAELPGVFVTCSHEVAPEFREFERFSTTAVNAYLGPVMRAYLEHLQPRVTAIGVSAPPRLTQSNGGVISAETAAEQPARLVLSGPAAGVMGALAVGRAAGIGDLITFDMGGTSTDVSLIADFRATMANDVEIHGYPLKMPMLDIHTVGAGGGSIAALDNGLLKVGPRSAGAAPGPVCYRLGNDEATVTDANVVLGVLNQTHLLGGRMPIDARAAHAAIARLAEELGLDVMATANGIIRVVIANMAKAIRVISIERGYDPRDYTMLAFGGAGPIHAARLARELDIRRVLVPRNPGILCALGLLSTDLRTNLSMTRLGPLTPDSGQGLDAGFAQLEARAAAWFAREGIATDDRAIARSLDMRYGGQGFELTVPYQAGVLDERALVSLRSAFERLHCQVYGYISEEEPIQVTTLRLEATGRVAKASFPPQAIAEHEVASARVGERNLFLQEVGNFVACPLYDREKLGPGHVIAGPTVIDQMDSTTLVLPGQNATVDAHLNLLIEDVS